MNREQAKRLLPIIQAFADGEDVQSEVICENGWADISYPDFDPVYKWRIKPKPLERWLVVNRDGETFTYKTHEKADATAEEMNRCGHAKPYRVVRMREVTE